MTGFIETRYPVIHVLIVGTDVAICLFGASGRSRFLGDSAL